MMDYHPAPPERMSRRRLIAIIIFTTAMLLVLPVTIVIGIIQWATPGENEAFQVVGASCDIDQSEPVTLHLLIGTELLNEYKDDRKEAKPFVLSVSVLTAKNLSQVKFTSNASDEVDHTEIALDLRLNDAGTPAELQGVRVTWGLGEPAYYQDLPVHLGFDGKSCQVAY
jgi:hypothetical protein